ncbi:MAG: hypothetical protein JSS27_16220 [Planctomycetes bacterium]|nr:hypothetical protein [Planctomycetota bacterium]
MYRQSIIKTSGSRLPRRASAGPARPCDAKVRAASRRGNVTIAMIVVLVVVLMFAAVAWNVAWLRHTHSELQTACESAALAGAAQLANPLGGSDRSQAILNARQAALSIATFHHGAGQRIALLDNPKNLPTGDVVAGLIAEPTQVGAPMQPWQGTGDVNTIRIVAHRNHGRGNPLGVRLGQMAGVMTADVSAHAQATIDRRVYGFRPKGVATCPVMPLVVDRSAWNMATSNQSVTDRFTVDVRHSQVLLGGDGVAEITVSAYLNAAAMSADPNATPATLCRLALSDDAQGNDTELSRQVSQGLTARDLRAWQGALLIPTGGCPAPVYNFVPAELTSLLLSVRGQPRAWPLAQLATSATGAVASQVTLVDFMAATVVDVELDTVSQPPRLLVTLQPTPLATSSALAAPGYPANPWLAKLMLSR